MKENSIDKWASLFKHVGLIAIPTAIGNAFEFLPVCFALSFVGNSSDASIALDAMALGRSWFNITSMAPMFGLLSALRTLCPQAVGAKRPELNQLYVQRAILILVIGAVPFCSLQFICGRTLRMVFGHSKELAEHAQNYAIRLVSRLNLFENMQLTRHVGNFHVNFLFERIS